MNLRKLACAILVLFIFVGGLLFLENVHAATTYVNGTISTQSWTPANSPYTLTGNVIVNYGSTLTIQPGVTVNFGGYQLTVAGTLKAQGSINSAIVFSSSEYSNQGITFNPTSTSSIVDYVAIYSVPIIINGGYTQISNSYFGSTSSTPITVNGASSSIQNNAINFQSCNGIQINGGSVSISNNLIIGQGQNYGIYTKGVATITNNNITNCFSGIYAVTQSTIQQNNVMYNANDGIRSDNSASLIQNNAIANNLCGISGTGDIESNTITGNSAGIWGPNLTAIITLNNIFANYNATSGYAQNIHMTFLDNLSFPNNWWGLTDVSAINQTIWDFKNDITHLGIVNFTPFLNQSNPTAPSVPSAIPVPTPPPSPTPVSSPSPSITPTPTASYAATPTPTSVAETSTPTSLPYSTPELTPTQTPQAPHGTPLSLIGNFSMTDITNMLVIVLAVAFAVTIIVVINLKSRKSQTRKTAKKQQRRKPRKVFPES